MLNQWSIQKASLMASSFWLDSLSLTIQQAFGPLAAHTPGELHELPWIVASSATVG